MRLIASAGKKLSQLTPQIEFYPQVLLNIKVKEKKPINKMNPVQDAISIAEKTLGGDGRVLVRYSGTENIARVMVEGKDKNVVEGLAGKISVAIKKEVGA